MTSTRTAAKHQRVSAPQARHLAPMSDTRGYCHHPAAKSPAEGKNRLHPIPRGYAASGDTVCAMWENDTARCQRKGVCGGGGDAGDGLFALLVDGGG